MGGDVRSERSEGECCSGGGELSLESSFATGGLDVGVLTLKSLAQSSGGRGRAHKLDVRGELVNGGESRGWWWWRVRNATDDCGVERARERCGGSDKEKMRREGHADDGRLEYGLGVKEMRDERRRRW